MYNAVAVYCSLYSREGFRDIEEHEESDEHGNDEDEEESEDEQQD